MKVFSCATLLIIGFVLAEKSTKVPRNFHSSSELSAFVKNSIDKDLETLNLLDRAMAAPGKRHQKASRKLKTKLHASSNAIKSRQLLDLMGGLFGTNNDGEEDSVMLDSLASLQSSTEPSSELTSHRRRPDCPHAEAP